VLRNSRRKETYVNSEVSGFRLGKRKKPIHGANATGCKGKNRCIQKRIARTSESDREKKFNGKKGGPENSNASSGEEGPAEKHLEGDNMSLTRKGEGGKLKNPKKGGASWMLKLAKKLG